MCGLNNHEAINTMDMPSHMLDSYGNHECREYVDMLSGASKTASYMFILTLIIS